MGNEEIFEFVEIVELHTLLLVLQKYIDQCPICKSRRYEAIPVKSIDDE